MSLSFKEVQEKINDAITFRDKEILPLMERNLSWYKGNYSNNKNRNILNAIDSDVGQYSVNFAYEIVRTIMSSIYSRNPEFSFMIKGNINEILTETVGLPVRIQHNKLEKALEKAVKIYFDELRVNRSNRRIVADAIWAGFGCSKIGYNIDLKEDLKELRRKDKKEFAKVAETLDHSDILMRDEPFLLRVNPMDILLSPDDDSLDELHWVCQVIFMTPERAKKLYGVNLPVVARSTFRSSNTSKDKNNMVKIFEFHDLNPDNPRIYILADGHNKFLENKKHPLYEKETRTVSNMFQFVWFNDSLDGVYPLPDISLVENQIIEANVNINRRIEFARRMRTQYIAKGVWEGYELDKIKKGKDGNITEVIDPNATIETLPVAQLGFDFYQNINAIRSEILEILGLTDYQLGGSTQKRKATEAQIIESSRQDRVQDRINIIEDFVFRQVDTFVELMKKYKSTNRLLKLQLAEGELVDFDFNGQLLELMDVDIRVISGSTVLLDKDAELRKFNALAQVAQAFGDIANREELWREFLKRMGITDTDKFIIAPQTAPLDLGGGSPPNISGLAAGQGQPTMTPAQLGQLPKGVS